MLCVPASDPAVGDGRVHQVVWNPKEPSVAALYSWRYPMRQSVEVFDLVSGTSRTLCKNDDRARSELINAQSLEFSPRGEALWLFTQAVVSKIDAATGDTMLKISQPCQGEVFTGLSVDPTGMLVATANSTGEMCLWRADDGALVARLKGHTGYQIAMHFTQDGRGLVSAAVVGDAQHTSDYRLRVKDPVLRFWNTQNQRCTQTIERAVMPVQMVLSSDDRSVVVAGSHALEVHGLEGHISDAPTTELKESLPQGGFELRALAFAREADVMVTTDPDGGAVVWRCSTGEPVARWTVGESTGLAVSPDGTRYVTCSGHTAVLRSARAKRALGEFKGHAKTVFCAAFSPDGRTVATGSDDREMKLWDARDCSLVRVFKGHRGRVGSLAFTSDGRVLVSAADDGYLRLWEAASGALLTESRVRSGVLRAMGVSGDGRAVVLASTEGASIWNPLTGTKRCELAGHTGAVVGAAMRGDGALAATLGEDHTLRLWRVADGVELSVLDGWLRVPGIFANTSERWAKVSGTLAFSGDGRLLGVGTGRERGGGALTLLAGA